MTNDKEVSDLLRQTQRKLLGEDREPSIRYLCKIFAAPEANAAQVRQRISREILQSDSGTFLVDVGKGLSDLSDGRLSKENQRQLLEDALAAEREKAESEPKDGLMLKLIAGVDVELLCAPNKKKQAELEERARKIVDVGDSSTAQSSAPIDAPDVVFIVPTVDAYQLVSCPTGGVLVLKTGGNDLVDVNLRIPLKQPKGE